MIFNVIIKQKRNEQDCICVEFCPEPYKYMDKYLSGYCIYDLSNVDGLINQKKEELRIHYYNDICSYDSDFANEYSL